MDTNNSALIAGRRGVGRGRRGYGGITCNGKNIVKFFKSKKQNIKMFSTMTVLLV